MNTPATPQGQDGVRPLKEPSHLANLLASYVQHSTFEPVKGQFGHPFKGRSLEEIALLIQADLESESAAPTPGSVSQATFNIIEECMSRLNEACTSNGETVKLVPYFRRAIDSETAAIKENAGESLRASLAARVQLIGDFTKLKDQLAAANGVNVKLRTALGKLPEQLVQGLYDSGRDQSGAPVVSVYWDGCSSEGRDKHALRIVMKPAFEAILADTASLGGFVAVEKGSLDLCADTPNLIIARKLYHEWQEQNAALRELVKLIDQYHVLLGECTSMESRRRRDEIGSLKRKAGL